MSDQPTLPPSSEQKPDARNEKTVKIEIVRHQRIFNLLENPIKLRRLFLFLVALILVVILGLTGILLTLKAFYPYNTITTTLNGATIIESEDGEVTYWLFNTAELWANSGIEVKKGDVLTIRASGASHTAIHHLANEAYDNKMISDKWVGTEGRKYPSMDLRNMRRNQFRIAPNEDEGVLLMQVIPNDSVKNGAITNKSNIYEYIDGRSPQSAGRLYVIGKERQNLVIKQDGTLHFSVNDVVLTDGVIEKMYNANIDLMKDSFVPDISQWDFSRVDAVTELCADKDSLCIINPDFENRIKEFNFRPGTTDSLCRVWENSFQLGAYSGYASPDTLNLLINELLYYKHHGFYDAWFVDNLGSFLIIIERKKAK